MKFMEAIICRYVLNLNGNDRRTQTIGIERIGYDLAVDTQAPWIL